MVVCLPVGGRPGSSPVWVPVVLQRLDNDVAVLVLVLDGEHQVRECRSIKNRRGAHELRPTVAAANRFCEIVVDEVGGDDLVVDVEVAGGEYLQRASRRLTVVCHGALLSSDQLAGRSHGSPWFYRTRTDHEKARRLRRRRARSGHSQLISGAA